MTRRRYSNNRYASGSRSRSNYSYRSRRTRRSAEREVEVISFGLIIVLFLAQLVFAAAFTTQLILLLGGIVLLGSAFYQSSRRWRVNPMTWIGGIAMFTFAILSYQTGVVPLGAILPLLIFGVVIVSSFLTGEF